MNDSDSHSDMLKLLDNNMIMSKDGAKRSFESYLGNHNINFFEINEALPNRNMILGSNRPEFKIQPILYREWSYKFTPELEMSSDKNW